MKEFKVLSKHQDFDVIEVDGMVGTKMKYMSIAIIPYVTNEHGAIEEVGLLKEYNPFREDNYAYTLITGSIEDKDDVLLETAKRELYEEGGYRVPENENERWVYLGCFYPYKDSDRQIPTFGVDITGISREEPETDGSKKESLSNLEMIKANNILMTEETLALSAFLRLFNFFYLKTTGHV
jgi:8-oxo-dGTP pyrophosphatase MutT (NUDIX family)